MKLSAIIAPADAMRQMLVARCGETALEFTEKIEDWLWYPETWRIPTCVREAADEMEKLLRKHIREGDIGLRGELNNNPSINIDRADCLEGKLDIFRQTLTIYRGRTARTYRNVFCVKHGVMRIVNSIATNQSKLKSGSALPAPDAEIRDQIGSVYSDAEKTGSKMPNLEELIQPVRKRLEPLNYKASRDRIRKIASEPRFKSRRGKVGKRLT